MSIKLNLLLFFSFIDKIIMYFLSPQLRFRTWDIGLKINLIKGQEIILMDYHSDF